MPESDRFVLPADLNAISDEDALALEEAAVAEYDRVRAIPDVTPDSLQYATDLARDIDVIKAENAGRKIRREDAAARAQAAMLDQQAHLDARVHGPAEPAEPPVAAPIDNDAISAAVASGVTSAMVALMDDNARRHFGITEVRDRPKAPLSEAAARQQSAPSGSQRQTITAS